LEARTLILLKQIAQNKSPEIIFLIIFYNLIKNAIYRNILEARTLI
jgi:hypothetical protein